MTVTPEQPDAATLRLRGDIDLATADDVAAEGGKLLADSGPGTRLVLDLAEVSFLDSSGLSALVRLRRAADEQGSQILLRNVPHRVAILLDLSGLAEHFPTSS